MCDFIYISHNWSFLFNCTNTTAYNQSSRSGCSKCYSCLRYLVLYNLKVVQSRAAWLFNSRLVSQVLTGETAGFTLPPAVNKS